MPTSKRGGGAAKQLGGTPLDEAHLRKLIQEAVDEALRAIQAGEAQPGPLVEAVAARLHEREDLRSDSLKALEGRLGELERRAKGLDDRQGRADQRLEEVAHFAGARDAVDIGRMPPEVVQRSFQAALDELVKEIASVQARGALERILDDALADVRGRSKGAELFVRLGDRIEIQGLERALERRLISAKAAQETFDEVIKHLRQHAPAHKPRPMAAHLRSRGHEFALRRADEHHNRLKEAEEVLKRLIHEAERIEAEARDAGERAAVTNSKSREEAAAERRDARQEFHGRISGLEHRAAAAEERLERALTRLEALERYAQRIETGVIRKTKDGSLKGDFTPVIDSVHGALEGGAARTIEQLTQKVRGVDREVVEAVVREGVREGIFVEEKGGKIRLAK